MEPIEYVRALIRRWPIIAIAAFIGAIFAFIGTEASPEPVESKYTATHTVLAQIPESFNQTLIGTTSFAQVPVFATTGEVPRMAAEQLGYGGPPAALAAQLVVESEPETGTIRFTTEQENPDNAVYIADAFADQTVAYLNQRQDELIRQQTANVVADIDRLEAEIQSFDQQIADELAAEAAALPENAPPPEANSVTVARRDAAVVQLSVAYETLRSLQSEDSRNLTLTTLERAQPVPVDTGGFSAPRTRATRVPIAAGIGALLGAGVALVVERLDAKVRDRRQAEEAFGAGIVGEIPTFSRRQRAARLIVGPESHHSSAEAFRSLRTSITFMAAGGRPLADDDHVGIILVTSPSPGEGKTTISANLAAAFAETGRNVVVVNADFRRPVVSSIVADERPTLPAGLAGIDRLNASEYLSPTKIPHVQLLDLSSLAGTPGDLTRATVRLTSAVAGDVDVLVIDTPPLAVTTEALEFVPLAQVVLFVARIGRTATGVAHRAGELVRFGGANQIGVAVNDIGSPRRRGMTYYDYYGGARRGRQGEVHDPVVDAVASDAQPHRQEGEWGEVDTLVEQNEHQTADMPSRTPSDQP